MTLLFLFNIRLDSITRPEPVKNNMKEIVQNLTVLHLISNLILQIKSRAKEGGGVQNAVGILHPTPASLEGIFR
ncbi:MAG: hypothetical protein P0S95_05860 [Rhabdochlamydiaceae bacterium]|nr:hypothetical protein [Candidatus Amphrikana amoebophyrae]